jgi:predicted transglutaminase-like cysteine proteinase
MTAAFDSRAWSLGPQPFRLFSSQLWLGSPRTFSTAQSDDAAPGGWSVGSVALAISRDGRGYLPRPAGAGLSSTKLGLAGFTRGAAVIDISMRPVFDSQAAPPPSLRPAIYTRPIVSPSSEQVVGQGGAPNIFGSVALAAGHTPLDAKWRRVADYVPSAAGGPWSLLLAQARRRSARDQLEVVNTWVNHAISYTTDVANYGVADYWGTARESLTRGRGDCKDYAIAKMELLRALGVPSDDLYLVLVKDLVRRQDHAVLAVRLDGRFVVLDSGFDSVMDSEDVRDYRPIVTYSGARTWVHGFRRTPDVMVASASTVTPAAVVSQ